MEWYIVIGSIIFVSASWTLTSIILNYNAARKIGFPIVISPVTPLNPFWILTTKIFPSVLLLRYLPFRLGTWAKCTHMGWPFQDKYALHADIGPVFTLVTPGGNEITVADPCTAHTIFTKRKEFIKPAIMYDQLNVFGPNLNTVEGKDWERQRRLTAPSFNEKTSSVVWNEAIRQTHHMIKSWLGEGARGTSDTVADTATLALHVLTCVGFGLTYPFDGGVRNLPKDHVMTYGDALSICLQNIITFAIIPKKFLSLSFLPEKLRTVGLATREFQQYMEEMLSQERSGFDRQIGSSINLMSALVRASGDSKRAEGEETSIESVGLTDKEIFGNIFVFNLAGHETTANTIASALVLLAANPACQNWLAEEIDQVFRDGTDYPEAFPRLKRCLAVMYETLRLYGSIVFVPKSTGFHPQTLTISDVDHTLPPGTAININVQALHTNPKTWGHDVLQWRPDRWLRPSTGDGGSTDFSLDEDLIEPAAGTYVPWADGPRVCVGRKFSQVEFVAVVASLFRDHWVRPALQAGQTEEDGKQALMKMVNGSAITYITLQMTKPKSVALVWEKR